jgi:hypothetical protein
MKEEAGALLRGGHSERQVARRLGSANGCAEAVPDLAEQAGEPASVGEGSVPGSESGHSFAPASHEGGKFGIAGSALARRSTKAAYARYRPQCAPISCAYGLRSVGHARNCREATAPGATLDPSSRTRCRQTCSVSRLILLTVLISWAMQPLISAISIIRRRSQWVRTPCGSYRFGLVRRICGQPRARAVCQVRDTARFP